MKVRNLQVKFYLTPCKQEYVQLILLSFDNTCIIFLSFFFFVIVILCCTVDKVGGQILKMKESVLNKETECQLTCSSQNAC